MKVDSSGAIAIRYHEFMDDPDAALRKAIEVSAEKHLVIHVFSHGYRHMKNFYTEYLVTDEEDPGSTFIFMAVFGATEITKLPRAATVAEIERGVREMADIEHILKGHGWEIVATDLGDKIMSHGGLQAEISLSLKVLR